MSTIKRVSGDYTIQTLNSGDSITLDSGFTTVTGDLTVVGNAVLLGNINADRIFNGTSNVEITTPDGNVQISVGGVNDVVDVGTVGMAVSGLIFASGNITAANVNTAGRVTATGNIDGGNLRTVGNILIARDASTATPEIRFDDSDITVSDGQVLGQIVWETSDATPGERSTTIIRSIASGVGGNANLQILTSDDGAAAAVRVTVLSTGNVGVGNAAPVHLFSVNGTGYFGSTLTAVGNVTGGNLLTAGSATATGNIVGGNIATAGLATVTGNITAGNVISLGAVSAGADGILATGNVTGGNLLTGGVISATGNLTTTDIFGSSISVSGNVTGNNASFGNAAVTANITGANCSISALLTGPGVGVPRVVYQSANATVSSATPVTMGSLQFDAEANMAYRFEAYVPVTPDGAMTVAPAVNFASGSCTYTTETQTTSSAQFDVVTKTASDDVAVTHGMTGTDTRTIRITGWFFHTGNVTVAMTVQNSTGNLVINEGSSLIYHRIA